MQDDLISIQGANLTELADLMYLAWRLDFILDEETGVYILKRDFLLEKIACLEEQLEMSLDDKVSDEDFHLLMELRTNYVNELFSPLYGGIESPVSYSDLISSLASIGEEMGWEAALVEVNKRFPDRLEIKTEKRGRHWKRAALFHQLKEFSEVFVNTIWGCHATLCVDNPPPLLGVSGINFATFNEWHKAMSIVFNPPSDESIFLAFKEVMQDRTHKYYGLFKVVNDQTDLLLLGSLKALERSLAIGRRVRRGGF